MPDAAGPGSPGPAGGRHAAPDDAPLPVVARAPRRARHRDRSWRRGPLVRGGLVVLALAVLVAAAALAPRLRGDDGTATAGPGTGAPPSAAAPSTDPAARPPSPAEPPGTGSPAGWLAAALPPSTDLAASAAVREELTGEGVPADRLRAAEDAPVSGSLLAVVGPPPAGSRVLARFDRPGDGSGLLVVDPAPGAPTAEQRERRRSLAAALLANPVTGADAAVTTVLRSGEVDLRLLTLVAGVAAREGVGIAAFPALPAEEGSATPARRVLLDALGAAPVPADPAATDALRAWLAAQLPPLAPDEVQVTDDGVLVSFRYASDPDALVTGATR